MVGHLHQEIEPPTVLTLLANTTLERLTVSGLQGVGFNTKVTANLEEAIASVGSNVPDAVLLELPHPAVDSSSTVGHLREAYAGPIIVILWEDLPKTIGSVLDRGADDYLTADSATSQQAGLVRSTIDRSQRLRKDNMPPVRLADGRIQLEPVSLSVFLDQRRVSMTLTEFVLLHELASSPGQAVEYSQILKSIWGGGHEDDPTRLRIFVRQLRKRLEPDPSRPQLILTDPGVGYRLNVDPETVFQSSAGSENQKVEP